MLGGLGGIMGIYGEAPMGHYVNYGTGSFTVASVGDPADTRGFTAGHFELTVGGQFAPSDAHALSDYFLI